VANGPPAVKNPCPSSRGAEPVIEPTSPRPLALIVDDVPEIREILCTRAKQRGYEVVEAPDGEAGVRIARERHPDLILLDLQLPKLGGMEALAEIREHDPHVSVVIVAAAPDPAVLRRALDLGAVNFVCKPFDSAEIDFVLDRVYRAVVQDHDLRSVLDVVSARTTSLVFPGQPAALARIVAWLGREISGIYSGYDLPLPEIKLALYETLANAVEHGNLGITYDHKSRAMEEPGGMEELIKQRLADPVLGARRVHVNVEYLTDRVVYRVRDEGTGFDPVALHQKPLGDTTALHGRGIALVRHYMDEVSWNPAGNEIRMVHRLKPRAAESTPT
jgi:DNA-binding response OmpR family regulator